MQAFVSYLNSECGLSHNTIEAYTSDLRLFTDFLSTQKDDLNLNAFEAQDVSAFVVMQTTTGHATSTVRRRVAAIRVWLKFQAINGHDVQHLLANIEMPKAEGRRLPRVLGRQQTVQLIDAAPNTRDAAILELLYATGIRASELCGLTIGHVNFTDMNIRVLGKGNVERVVPMHETAAAKIKKYLAGRTIGFGFVFLDDRGAQLDRDQLWYIVRRAWKASGLAQKVSPHTLRHCFASHLLSGHDAIEMGPGGISVHLQNGGTNIRVVQELLGHASVDTTQRYTHVDFNRLKRTQALLGR